jgi:hypothetical protein
MARWGGPATGAPGRGWRAVRRGREVRILTPTGETALVFLGSPDALEQLGVLLPDGSLPPELGGGGARPGSAAARVAALAGEREFGPEDYDALAALDEDDGGGGGGGGAPNALGGLRRRGGRGPRVTPADVDMLPTHAHRPRPRRPPAVEGGDAGADASGAAAGGGGGGGGDDDAPQDSCPICLAPWEAGDCVRTLPCLHRFCAGCVDPWLTSHGRGDAACPVCKTLVFAGQ